MIDSVCQAYHWSLPEAMRLTLPQIIMLNHAAWANQERGKRRYEVKREKEKNKSNGPLKASEIVVDGKPFDEMTSEEIAFQVMNWE